MGKDSYASAQAAAQLSASKLTASLGLIGSGIFSSLEEGFGRRNGNYEVRDIAIGMVIGGARGLGGRSRHTLRGSREDGIDIDSSGLCLKQHVDE